MTGILITGCNSLEKTTKIIFSDTHHPKLVFTGVNVISMVTDTVLKNKTVYIDDGMITGIKDSGRPIDPAYDSVDAAGKYLMPGLTDMHVHISDEGDMLKFLRYGVTTVRNMADIPKWTRIIGFPAILNLKEKQIQKKIFGPDVFTCGFCLDGKKPVSPMNKVIPDANAAHKEVVDEIKRGYDFIKIYDKLSPEAYSAIVSACNENNIQFMGHVPKQVGIKRALGDRIHSIEHLLGYIDNNIADFTFSPDETETILELTRQNPTYNCPTMVVWKNLPGQDDYNQLKKNPEFQYVSGQVRWLWKTSLPYYYRKDYPDKNGYPARMYNLTSEFTRKLYDQGCPLLIGTDSNVIGTFVGLATWQEMEHFSHCGIKNYDILCSATKLAAKALGKENNFGTLEPGKKANLILLENNPLENIRNIQTLSGVTINGFYLTKALIDKIVNEYYN